MVDEERKKRKKGGTVQWNKGTVNIFISLLLSVGLPVHLSVCMPVCVSVCAVTIVRQIV